MKKLELKNLKVVKISEKEKASIIGGNRAEIGPHCGNSGANSCNETSAWPIGCTSMGWLHC